MTPYPLCFPALLLVALPPADISHEARSRTFRFTYAAVVTGLKPDQPARIWLPVPPSNDDQDAAIVSRELPAEGKIGRDAEYGNELLYLDAKADSEGKISLKIVYKVTRRELKGDGGHDVKESADLLARYLKADARAQSTASRWSCFRARTCRKTSWPRPASSTT